MALNRDVQLTLEDAVEEVLGLLTGLDISYMPEQDRFRTVTRALNRALRSVALEHDWSYYSGDEEVSQCVPGVQEVEIPANLRPRVSLDDAVRLVTDGGTTVIGFAFMVGYYGLPFVFSLYFQQLRGLSALATGALFLPMMLIGAALTPLWQRAPSPAAISVRPPP